MKIVSIVDSALDSRQLYRCRFRCRCHCKHFSFVIFSLFKFCRKYSHFLYFCVVFIPRGSHACESFRVFDILQPSAYQNVVEKSRISGCIVPLPWFLNDITALFVASVKHRTPQRRENHYFHRNEAHVVEITDILET